MGFTRFAGNAVFMGFTRLAGHAVARA